MVREIISSQVIRLKLSDVLKYIRFMIIAVLWHKSYSTLYLNYDLLCAKYFYWQTAMKTDKWQNDLKLTLRRVFIW